jgi:hypothetical protein
MKLTRRGLRPFFFSAVTHLGLRRRCRPALFSSPSFVERRSRVHLVRLPETVPAGVAGAKGSAQSDDA